MDKLNSVYTIAEGVKDLDLFDLLAARHKQLAAVLAVMAGPEGTLKDFDRLGTDTRMNCAWLCESLAAECLGLTGALQDARSRKEAIHQSNRQGVA